MTIDNLDQYVNLSLQFIFRDGIRRQMDAFRSRIEYFEISCVKSNFSRWIQSSIFT